jgi:hypothetical protein
LQRLSLWHAGVSNLFRTSKRTVGVETAELKGELEQPSQARDVYYDLFGIAMQAQDEVDWFASFCCIVGGSLEKAVLVIVPRYLPCGSFVAFIVVLKGKRCQQ